MSKVQAVGTTEWSNEVLGASEPVVVDFWAEWCPPCKMLAPVVDRVAEQYQGRVKVVKVDVDQNQELAMRYGIQGIPNLLFFKNGQVVNQAVGFMSDAQLAAKIDSVLSS